MDKGKEERGEKKKGEGKTQGKTTLAHNCMHVRLELQV